MYTLNVLNMLNMTALAHVAQNRNFKSNNSPIRAKAQYTDSREAKNLVKSIQISTFFHHVKQEVKCVGEFFFHFTKSCVLKL